MRPGQAAPQADAFGHDGERSLLSALKLQLERLTAQGVAAQQRALGDKGDPGKR